MMARHRKADPEARRGEPVAPVFPAGADERTVLLDVTGVDAGYGRQTVLRGVSIRVGEGESVAVVGAAGTGKTTLVRALTGLNRPSHGTIAFAGADVTDVQAHSRVKLGIVSPGGAFSGMSVRENLELGCYVRSFESKSAYAERFDRVFELLPRLKTLRDRKGASLGRGDQRLLAFGRALLARPRLLVLDEPSTDLAPSIVGQIIGAIDSIRASGASVLLTDRDGQRAPIPADRMYRLENGVITGESFGVR